MGGYRRRSLAVLGAGALVGAAIAPVGIGYAATRAESTAARITISIPGTVTAGTAVVLRGRVSHAPGDSTVDLESRPPVGGRWTVLARGAVVHGRFAVTWRPRSASFVMARVILVRHARTLARTTPASVLIGAAPVYCAAASPPGSLPPGDGYIVGGVYNVGGPAPGITVCQGEANTVTVTGASGATVASQAVPAGQSYTFVLPAGTYQLSTGYCRGQATVTAGAGTHADTVCAVP
jgi:hypothetical protein